MSIVTFFNSGSIGGFKIGLSRGAVVEAVGMPPEWFGKPPVIGCNIEDPMRSDVWYYYNSSVGICFTQSMVIGAIFVKVSKIQSQEGLFSGWPPVSLWTISQLIVWLKNVGIEYEISREDEVPGWLAISKRCVVSTRPAFLKSELQPYRHHTIVDFIVCENCAAAERMRRTGEWH